MNNKIRILIAFMVGINIEYLYRVELRIEPFIISICLFLMLTIDYITSKNKKDVA